MSKLIEGLARRLANDERAVSRRDVILGPQAAAGAAFGSALASQSAAVASTNHIPTDPGAAEILAILRGASLRLKRDTHELTSAVRVKPDGTFHHQRLLRDIRNERHDLANLRSRIEGVRCQTPAGRRGRTLTLKSIKQTEDALLALSHATVASDPGMIKNLADQAKRLSAAAKHNCKQGLALLER
jgi:hypothetical protein